MGPSDGGCNQAIASPIVQPEVKPVSVSAHVAIKRVLVLNGPNLNMLGTRQPEIYGRDTLDDISAACTTFAHARGWRLDFRQSNCEGELVTWIQSARTEADALVINPAAFTHTSVAILDALLLLDIPVIEVHLSNIHKREEFRHHSFVSRAATGVIAGFGAKGYLLALSSLED
jgi:3-dehydroquinate dehydratase II